MFSNQIDTISEHYTYEAETLANGLKKTSQHFLTLFQ